jgi:putative membrane protein (TIGR04086 family)
MEEKKSPVRLLRITTAALFAELIPLIILVATVTVYGFIGAPGQDKAVYESFAEKAGNYIGPIAGTLATLGMGFWAARKPTEKRLLHGLLTGVFVVLLDLAIFASPKADFDLTDALILAGKFIAGTLGGYLAQRRYQNMPAEATKNHRVI